MDIEKPRLFFVSVFVIDIIRQSERRMKDKGEQIIQTLLWGYISGFTQRPTTVRHRNKDFKTNYVTVAFGKLVQRY